MGPVRLGNIGQDGDRRPFIWEMSALDIARLFGGTYGLGVIYAQAMVGKGPND